MRRAINSHLSTMHNISSTAMNTKIKSLFIGIVAGVIVACISVYLLEYLAAISYPASLFVWAIDHSVLGVFTSAIQFIELLLGACILAALASYFLAQKLTVSWVYLASAFVITQALVVYLFVPHLSGQVFNETKHFLPNFPYVMTTSFCVFVFAYWGGTRQNA